MDKSICPQRAAAPVDDEEVQANGASLANQHDGEDSCGWWPHLRALVDLGSFSVDQGLLAQPPAGVSSATFGCV